MGMKVVMLGIVGAGKGTQAGKLAKHLDIPHISTGDIFRDASQRGTELGVKARDIMNQGGLVPDDIVIGIVKDRIQMDDAGSGYILDGFPRTVKQASKFDEFENIDKIFYINIPQEEVLKRLLGRRSCNECGKQFNVNIHDFDDECTDCGGKITVREDDNEDTIKVRVQKYIEQTEPLINFYKEKDLLVEIDGFAGIEEVFKKIKESI